MYGILITYIEVVSSLNHCPKLQLDTVSQGSVHFGAFKYLTAVTLSVDGPEITVAVVDR